MPVQDVCIDWALECRQRMVGCHHRDEIDREQGEALQERDVAEEKLQQSNHAGAVEYQFRGGAERLHIDARRNQSVTMLQNNRVGVRESSAGYSRLVWRIRCDVVSAIAVDRSRIVVRCT